MASVSTPEAPVSFPTNLSPLLPPIAERTPAMVLTAIASWGYWDEIKGVVVKEYGMSEDEYSRLLPEYHKFLGLVFLGHTPIGMFSRSIDEIWHAHVLSMHLYHQFFLDIHGQIVYHIPQIPTPHTGICTTCRSCTNCSGGGQGGGGKRSDAYANNSAEAFFLSYTKAYGVHPPEDIWDLSVPEGLCISN